MAISFLWLFIYSSKHVMLHLLVLKWIFYHRCSNKHLTEKTQNWIYAFHLYRICNGTGEWGSICEVCCDDQILKIFSLVEMLLFASPTAVLFFSKYTLIFPGEGALCCVLQMNHCVLHNNFQSLAKEVSMQNILPWARGQRRTNVDHSCCCWDHGGSKAVCPYALLPLRMTFAVFAVPHVKRCSFPLVITKANVCKSRNSKGHCCYSQRKFMREKKKSTQKGELRDEVESIQHHLV